MSTPKPIRILFLCTGNSARSIMAEAIANERYGQVLEAQSAGSQPKGEPNPLALKTLARHGLAEDKWRSKSWDAFRDQPFDLVITLCDSAAAESCPVFPGAPAKAHGGFPDPPAADDPTEAFERVYLALDEAFARFVTSDEPNLAKRARDVGRFVAEHPVQAIPR